MPSNRLSLGQTGAFFARLMRAHSAVRSSNLSSWKTNLAWRAGTLHDRLCKQGGSEQIGECGLFWLNPRKKNE